MKNILRIMCVTLAICGVAAADAFTPATLPTANQPQNSSQKLSVKVADVNSFSAAAKTSDGYIGTVRLEDGYDFTITNSGPSAAPVPEPGSLVLLASGMALAALRRKAGFRR
jgi:hypothetical protein